MVEPTPDSDLAARKRRAVRTALVLLGIVLVIFFGYIYMNLNLS